MSQAQEKPLALILDDAASEVYTFSDKVSNIKLMIALSNPEHYGHILKYFYHVMCQLEESIEKAKEEPAIQGLHSIMKELSRKEAMEKDLTYYLGEDWKTKSPPTDATQAYVSHLKAIASVDPVLLLPHVYHLYGILLAHGQTIQQFVDYSFTPYKEKKEHQGRSNLYDFPGNRMVLKKVLKDKINIIKCGLPLQEKLKNESVLVYRMTNQVVRSLEGTRYYLLRWIQKWIVVILLIYLAYSFFQWQEARALADRLQKQGQEALEKATQVPEM